VRVTQQRQQTSDEGKTRPTDGSTEFQDYKVVATFVPDALDAYFATIYDCNTVSCRNELVECVIIWRWIGRSIRYSLMMGEFINVYK